MFADKDLANESTLNRAIGLLHHKSQGQNEGTRVLGLHITYHALPGDIRNAATSEEDLTLRKAGKLRLEQKKAAMKRLIVPWAKKDTKGKASLPKPREQDVSRVCPLPGFFETISSLIPKWLPLVRSMIVGFGK